jgi:DNA-binding response OmpR family regulator
MGGFEPFRNKTLLYVEDDEALLEQAKRVFDAIFARTYTARDGIEALSLFEKEPADIVISDIKMPRMNGVELCRRLRQRHPTLPIILTSAYDDAHLLKEALKLGITTFIEKPYDAAALQKALGEALAMIDRSIKDRFDLGDGYTFCTKTSQLYFGDEPLHLTPQERLLLRLLITAPHHTLSYESLEYALGREGYITKGALRTAVSSLRKKIGKEKIKNISKEGYRLCV